MSCFGSTRRYRGQDYDKLKKEAKAKGNLFIDLEFPPDDRSLFYTSGKLAGVVWKRPKDITATPKLFVEGASAGDVTQGRLGNCWFVSAASCLAAKKEVWHRVIPDADGQEWNEEKPEEYQGIFRFKFWRYGEWVEVVVDDFLPTINDELVFIHSQQKNEFWSALLEKAYAKMFGCYEALDGGDLGEALEDFTGGVTEPIDLTVSLTDKEKETLFAKMNKEIERRSLMAASIPAQSSEEMEASTDVGLVKGHAYGITAVKNIHLEGSGGIFSFFNKEKIPMVRLRNPWGQGEWKGKFSDNDPEWQKIPKAERERVGVTFEEDGEFWMTFDDFCQYFQNAAICRVVNTSIFALSKTWHEGQAHGAWKTPNRAGGCLNNRDTFLNNPQYVFDVTDKEDEVLFHLTQKSSRGKGDNHNNTIGFSILKVEENRRNRMHDLSQQEIIKSSAFRNSRSIFMRHTLTKGRYAIVVCTFDPNIEENFLLRVYTSNANNFMYLRLDKPSKPWWNCCAGSATMVTRVKVMRADGLERQDRSGGADPYCIISCEKEKVRTPTVQDSTSPTWETSAIFYRKKPMQNPLKIQIWNSNLVRDQYMGKHVFVSADECKDKVVAVDLVGRGKEGDQKRPGQLYVQITQTKNLMSL